MNELSPRELKAHLETVDPMPFILDVREPGEFEICHIEGATLLPMGEVPGALEQLPRDRAIVVVCHHGIRSQRIAGYLSTQGFEQIYNLRGGIDAWARTVDPDMPVY